MLKEIQNIENIKNLTGLSSASVIKVTEAEELASNYSVLDCSEILNLTVIEVRKLVKVGQLEGRKVNGMIWITGTSIKKFKEN